MSIVAEIHGRQGIFTEPEQAVAQEEGKSGWGPRKYRLTFLFSVTALVIIAVAAVVSNYVVGGLAESDLTKLAELNTFRDASHIQSMMRGRHTMIGLAPMDSTEDPPNMENMDQRMATAQAPMASMADPSTKGSMDMPMAAAQAPLTLKVLASPSGLPAHFPMLVDGLGIVKSNLLDMEGRTIWSTDSVSLGTIKRERSLFQMAVNGQVGSKLLRDLEVVHLDGVSRKIDVVDTYSPLRETADGPVIGVLELFKDVTTDVSVQVDEAKSAVLWTTVATMGGLYLILLGFILMADMSINRGYTRGVELVEEANRTLEERVIGRTGELAATNEELKNEIDERQRVEDDLLAARDVALEAVRAKSEFLASMSHEIRTPLNAIIGMADLLAESQLDEKQQDYVQVFQTAGDTLLNTINDILDLSKLESGQLSLEDVGFDLRELVDNAATVLTVRAREQGLVLNCSIAPDVPTALVGDPARLSPVITNLLGNAIKFTDSGEVALHVENDPEMESYGALRFSVSDTGIGIPTDKLEAIFENFVQADSSTTREYGGTGLGLAISRRLVDLMGGRIWVESIVGEGSTFYFTACFEVQTDANGRPTGDLEELDGCKVLVAADHDTSREILRDMVEAWGASTTEATTGYQVLAELDSAAMRSEPYDLLIIDQRLPGMDGLEVATRIQRDRQIACRIVIRASHAGIDEIPRFKEMGIAYCLKHPVDQSELLDAIRTARNPVDVSAAETVSVCLATREDRPLKILLAEDAMANRKLVNAYLEATPHQLDIAENGEIAVRKFVSGNYDLVLMDMQMPVMDGYAATKAIRKWQSGIGISPTPILALTAFAMDEEVQKCLDAGCTAHLAKPIRKAQLLDAINKHGELVG